MADLPTIGTAPAVKGEPADDNAAPTSQSLSISTAGTASTSTDVAANGDSVTGAAPSNTTPMGTTAVPPPLPLATPPPLAASSLKAEEQAKTTADTVKVEQLPAEASVEVDLDDMIKRLLQVSWNNP